MTAVLGKEHPGHLVIKRALGDLCLLADEHDCRFISLIAMLMIHFLTLPTPKQTLLAYMLQNLCDLVDANRP